MSFTVNNSHFVTGLLSSPPLLPKLGGSFAHLAHLTYYGNDTLVGGRPAQVSKLDLSHLKIEEKRCDELYRRESTYTHCRRTV